MATLQDSRAPAWTADIDFGVSRWRAAGLLNVSKGAIVWRPASKKRGLVMGWATFDRVKQREG